MSILRLNSATPFNLRPPATLLRPPFHERPAFARHRLKVDPLKLHECAQLYRLALFRFESEETVSNDGQQVLRELIATLKISFDDLGKCSKLVGRLCGDGRMALVQFL